MHSLIFIISYLFCSFTSGSSQKLICSGQVIDDHKHTFDHVIILFESPDSERINFTNLQEFDPSRKTILIIHGLSFDESWHQWAFEMGKKWFELVKL